MASVPKTRMSGGDDGPERQDAPPEVVAKLVEGRRIGFEMALVMTSDYDEANDIAQVVQESLWEMWRSKDRGLDLSKPLPPLVHTIVGRRWANILRAEADHKLPLIKEAFALESSARTQLDSALHAEAAELGAALSETVNAMPELQREIWKAVRLRGLTREQVAAELGKTTASISAHLYAAGLALKATKEKFEEDGR